MVHVSTTTDIDITIDRILSPTTLTIDELFQYNKGQLRMLTWAGDIVELLEKNGYRSLGWLNDHKSEANQILHDDFQDLFSNESGSYCIYVNRENKTFYCMDMGD